MRRSERLVRMKEISQLADGRGRVVIERVSPQIDCGRFPVKRVVGETVVVEADVFADGHDLSCTDNDRGAIDRRGGRRGGNLRADNSQVLGTCHPRGRK